jgi:hypothetical protein
MTMGKIVAALTFALPEAILGAYYKVLLGGSLLTEGFSWPLFIVLYPLFVLAILMIFKARE